MTNDFKYPEEVRQNYYELCLSKCKEAADKYKEDLDALTRTVARARREIARLNVELEISERILAEYELRKDNA